MNNKKWKFREDMLGHYINNVSSNTFQDAEDRLNFLEDVNECKLGVADEGERVLRILRREEKRKLELLEKFPNSSDELRWQYELNMIRELIGLIFR